MNVKREALFKQFQSYEQQSVRMTENIFVFKSQTLKKVSDIKEKKQRSCENCLNSDFSDFSD